MVATQTIDVEGLVDAAHRLIEALPGEVRSELQEELFAEMAEEFEDAGMSAQQLFGMAKAFGPNVTLAISAPAAQAGSFNFPSASLFLDVQQDGVADRIVGMLREQGAPLKQTDFEGHTIHYVKIPEGPGLTPSIVQMGRHLVLTSDLRSMKATLLRGADAPSLADQPDFQAVQERFEGASSMQVLRLGHHIASYYQAYGPMLDGLLAQNEELNLTFDDLPTPEELRRLMADVVLAVSRDERGVTMTNEGTVTFSTGLALCGAIAHRALTVGAN